MPPGMPPPNTAPPSLPVPPAAPSFPVLDLSTATPVICLEDIIHESDLNNDEDMLDILEDTAIECRKCGTLVSMVAPRPGAAGEGALGAEHIQKRVFAMFSSAEEAAKCAKELHGKTFEGQSVRVTFVPTDLFAQVQALPCFVEGSRG